MSLATRCPHCGTTFRVTHDQLKLRGGLVRCGACKEIFNGVESLLPPTAELTAPTAPAAAAPLPTTAKPASSAAASPAIIPTPSSPAAPLNTAAVTPVTPLTPVAPVSPAAPDPLTRMTLVDIRPPSADDWTSHGAANGGRGNGGASGRSDQQQPPGSDTQAGTVDDLSRAIDDLQKRPWRRTDGQTSSGDELDALDQDEPQYEPQFMRQARRQTRHGRRRHLLLVLITLLLLLLALAQGAYLLRNHIAAMWPITAPALTDTCKLLGCRIDLPARIDAVSIEASELQALPEAERFLLSTLLRNRSSMAMAWPHLELSLLDATDKVVARRVLTPVDYLTNAERGRGFAANTERPVRLTIAIAPPAALGYRLYVFYP